MWYAHGGREAPTPYYLVDEDLRRCVRRALGAGKIPDGLLPKNSAGQHQTWQGLKKTRGSPPKVWGTTRLPSGGRLSMNGKSGGICDENTNRFTHSRHRSAQQPGHPPAQSGRSAHHLITLPIAR